LILGLSSGFKVIRRFEAAKLAFGGPPELFFTAMG
jgi:hypothetical protein